jgi:hypothetical protein
MTAGDAIEYPRVRKVYSTRKVLKVLGVPSNARWPDVAPLIKSRIVSARIAQDDQTASEWSNIKAFLRRNLRSVCATPGCGAVIKPGTRGGLRCAPCSYKHHPNVERRAHQV